MIEDLCLQLGEAGAAKRRPLELEMDRSTAPSFHPVEIADVISSLKLPSGTNETGLTALIAAITKRLEDELNKGFIQQSWQQTQSTVPSVYTLFRRPILSVTSISYIPSLTDDTPVTVDATAYMLSATKDKVRTRTNWPVHRGWKSWTTEFKVGYLAIPDTPTDEQKANARAAVPAEIVQAILQWIGHLYENREGQGPDLKYEVIAKRIGLIPANVLALVSAHSDRRLLCR